MPFSTVKAYENFHQEVRHQNRYILSQSSVDFLDELSKQSQEKSHVIPPGFILYRAQIGYDWDKIQIEESGDVDFECPFGHERMMPNLKFADEGRINPKGIICLYAAEDVSTAISECRPWLSALVSMVELCSNKSLKFVDCTDVPDYRNVYFEIVRNTLMTEPKDDGVRNLIVWSNINTAFSIPVNPNEKKLDYRGIYFTGLDTTSCVYPVYHGLTGRCLCTSLDL